MPSKIIHAGRMIDTDSGDVRERVSIVIDGNLIKSVQPGYIQGDNIIDLKNSTVMPGFMDMHTHLMLEVTPQSYSDEFFKEESYFAIRATVNAKKTLAAGFTTVRDLGSDPRVTKELKAAIDRGEIAGPRIFNAGKSIGTTGGHVDPTNGRNFQLMKDPGT